MKTTNNDAAIDYTKYRIREKNHVYLQGRPVTLFAIYKQLDDGAFAFLDYHSVPGERLARDKTCIKSYLTSR